jgi:hypothetical protein
MGRPMEERKSKLSTTYQTIVSRNPVINKGLFKPDLKPLCDKYDKNLVAYQDFAKRKTNLVKYLQQLAEAMKIYAENVTKLATQRAEIYKNNSDMGAKYSAQLNDFAGQGDKADTSKVADAIGGFADSFKRLVELDKACADRKEKMDAEWETGLKRITDSYTKESKDIKTGIDKLTADEDRLDAQIRQGILNYQKTAVQIDNSKLEGELDILLTCING